MTHIIQQCWATSILPKSWLHVHIICIYKGKTAGPKADPNSYRGISLLNIASRILSDILLNRLSPRIDRRLHDSQNGFRKGRSTEDAIFSIRRITEEARAKNRLLYLVYIDLQKAYDRIPRPIIWEVLGKMQVDGLLLDLLKALYNETTAAVSLKGGITSDTFATRCGVKQGCPLSCVIFNAIMDCLMRKLIATKFPGINIKWRIPRGKRHSGDVVQGSETIGLLTYADDIVIWSDKEEELKNCIECFSDISKIWGMSVNTNKTKYQVLQPSNSNERRTSCMSVGEKNLQQVENYRYLGSTIKDNAKFDSEMVSRVQSAQGKLTGLNLIWKSRIISRKTKGILFRYAQESLRATDSVPPTEYGNTRCRFERALNN